MRDENGNIIYSIDTIREDSKVKNPVVYSVVIGGKKWHTHKLENSVTLLLGSKVITIPKGFTWDLSSVPRIFWSIIRPFGYDDIAYLIHDYLYQNKPSGWDRSRSDKEMLLWAKAMKGTKKVSFRNWDIYIRYYAVKLFGKKVWEDE